MKTYTLDFPVISWGTATVEVEDSVTADEVLDAIHNDEIEVIYDGKVQEVPTPLLSISDLRDMNLGEIPYDLQVSE